MENGNQLEKVFNEAQTYFRDAYLTKHPEIIHFKVNRADGLKTGTITKYELLKKFKSLVGSNSTKSKDSFLLHVNKLESLLAYSSSPLAFSQAWKFRKTKISKLSLFEVQELVSRGAQLIPTLRGENILNSGEKGMIGSEDHLAFLLGVRHSKGNYDDALDDLGNFSYQPPADALGMLRYRWLEVLTVKFNLPLFMYVTMWFKHEVFKTTNHVTLISPVKITSLNSSFDAPLNLQLITLNEGVDRSMMMRSLDQLEFETNVRSSLPEELVAKFNYESIKDNPLIRNKIIQWSISKNRRCPGDKCGNILFKDIKSRNQIHLGHIIPQKWGGVFHYIQEKNHINHPDNLYLTCNICNTSLNYRFPYPELMNNIVSGEFGTIGDFIRADITYFSRLDEG